MTTVSIIGGTGYAGSHIAAAAAERGFTVRSFSRQAAKQQLPGVTYDTASIAEAADRARILDGADVVVVAIAPRGDMAGRVRPLIAELAGEAATAGVRLGVIGGAGSLQQFEGGPLVREGADFPAAIQDEAREMGEVLEDLRASDASLDWFFVSPAGGFGPWAAGEATGSYRVGGDVLLVDAKGESQIGGADFGLAIADELEKPQHRRTRFTVAY
ncbi:NAD(P)H-binding protein [Leucobacter insecticola]|uniref:NAD(P)H-binding protein n=1 Tax=Leucobacter insecticola TaxID=2714934 RepID=A0A6G8FJC8_9MICO|nr:NAD(P)H-binding protein [Leucobacter insecticola]QIM16475.1 NAD(P)H-binding protein [Leucobacter insecticola]